MSGGGPCAGSAAIPARPLAFPSLTCAVQEVEKVLASVSALEHVICYQGGEAHWKATHEKIQGCSIPHLTDDKYTGLVSFQISRMK